MHKLPDSQPTAAFGASFEASSSESSRTSLGIRRRRLLAAVPACAALVAGAAHTGGHAQGQPNVTKLIVGFPPGGSGDLFARILAERLQTELGGPVVVDNRAGGGGLTAVAAFQRAPADGYTLMMHTGSTAITAPISRKVPPYNPVEDFAWIALLTNAPFIIAINPALPAQDLKSLVAYAKAQNGKLSYGHAGLGTTVHLAGELFKERAGIAVADIPYAGSGPALTDTIAGNVAFIVETYGTLIQHHKSGKLRIVGALSETRLPEMPEIGTAREAGFDVVAGTSNLLAAPLGTPPERQAVIAAAVARVTARADFQQQLATLGIQAFLNSNPQEARSYVAREVARWTPLVKKLGIAL
jgi:tripartite-type tricarboxylate transporter receptor subunit TctC